MASSVKDGSEVVHTDGRKCRYTDDRWWFHVTPGTISLTECERAHHPWPSDRGDFGMPGLGSMAEGIKAAGWSASDMKMPVARITEWPTLTVRNGEFVVDYGEQGYSIPIPTDDARHILMILPDIIEQFLLKNAKYAMVESGYDLGDAGIIPDLNRKLGILIKRLWKRAEFDEREESTDEVIGDMIGHLLLMLAKRRGQR